MTSMIDEDWGIPILSQYSYLKSNRSPAQHDNDDTDSRESVIALERHVAESERRNSKYKRHKYMQGLHNHSLQKRIYERARMEEWS